jgi:hypothetical protein
MGDLSILRQNTRFPLMDFSISQLLILLFFLLPLIERFFGKKKGQQPQRPEREELEIDDQLPEMTWEETLERLESVLKGEVPPSPEPEPAIAPRATRARELSGGSEFKSLAPRSPLTEEERQKLYSQFDVFDDGTDGAIRIRLDRQHLRESVVLNEILSRPVSMRRRSA